MCYRLSLQKANHRGTDMYTVPIQQSGMSYYDSIGHGGGGSSYFDRLPRSSSVSSYRSTNFDNSFTRTLPRRLNTSSLSRPLADYSSPTRTRYTPTTSTSVGLSSKPPLPSTSLYSTSRYNRATNYDVLDANSYGAHRYNNGISHRSASMDRRLGGGSEGTTTFDRRNIYDELGSNGSSSGVGQLANKYERLSVSARSSDSGYRSLTRRTPSPPVLDATAKDSMSARNGYHHQRRDSSSDEVETRDELTSMRATTPSRSIYRSSAASMPDVPSGIRASANAHDSSRTFCRNEPVRSSGSSVESLRSSSSGRRLAKRSTSPSISSESVASVSKQDPMMSRGLLGLNNIGNTCFMNSMLQCLSHTRPLLEYCLHEWDRTDMNNNTSRMKGALMKAYCDLLQQLWADARSSSGNYVSPDNFKNQIQKFAPRFVGYQQQDSQEFLRYLLQGLHEDVNRVRTKPTPLPPMDDTLPDSQKAMECWKRYLRTDDSKIVDVFVGQLKSELICTHCGHTSTTFDPFWDLSLPIPNDRRSSANINLEDCLTAFTREEVLDGDEMPKCEKCCVHRRCTKKFSVYKFPKILVLHLKRFSGERFRSRLSTLVNYPIANLDLGRFGASGCGHSLYNLYAVSNHTGTPTMGHYTAYVRHAFSGQWQLFDDSRVTPCRNVVTSEAYVLFYELATDKTVQESSRL